MTDIDQHPNELLHELRIWRVVG